MQAEEQMTEKIILITGGSRGIGAATAQLAAVQGYAVCISYLQRGEAAEQVVSAIRNSGGEAIAVRADVAVEADVVRLFKTLDRSFGRLTALVNNAGTLERQMRVEEMDAARLNRVFATNVTGSLLCAREAIRRMSTGHGGNGGAIVNVSSAASRLGSPNEYVDYAASKGAVDTMTIGLAKEVAAEGIRVNAVRPGVIYTEIHAGGGEPGRVDRVKDSVPMKRGGDALEVANAILWLLSDHASYTTGAFIDVAGGR
jgi:NAD(P)-dependent dehydrogenase (short-subunit alcohol dehydrogenase family)